MKLSASLAVILLSLFNIVWAGDYFEPAVLIDLNEIEGLDPTGFIPADPEDLVIPIRFVNVDEARTAISNGFEFRGDGVTYSDISAEWNPAFPWDWPHAVELGVFPPYFDLGTFINYFFFSDGVGLAGLTGMSGTGLPADFDGIAYFVTLHDAIAQSGGKLVIDSSYWLPSNFWLWSGVEENVYWGGPYLIPGPECHECEPYTTCWPQPWTFKSLENDRLLNIIVHDEDNDDVILESMLVQGKIPPYTEARIEGDSIVTDCFSMKFIGVSGWRPWPSEGIEEPYTVEYDKVDGSHVVLTGIFTTKAIYGDVTFDGQVNVDDVLYITEYFFKGGPGCQLWGHAMDEFMDIDANGRVDIRDLQKLIEITGI
ncbi:MAG: hypothetical protein JSU74_03030 [Candidatus Zixiibacteriota bacterium]|nr:MAG: hypothetical protein JSU74_03030 [candidate division Zixibacteria bacterium]